MTRLLLVHIAKTGGTSLRRLFKATQGLSTFDCVHNGTLLHRRINPEPLPQLIADWDEICRLIEPTDHAWMLAA